MGPRNELSGPWGSHRVVAALAVTRNGAAAIGQPRGKVPRAHPVVRLHLGAPDVKDATHRRARGEAVRSALAKVVALAGVFWLAYRKTQK